MVITLKITGKKQAMGHRGTTITSWKPGESGNPNGRPLKGTSLTELMREHLDKVGTNNITNKEIFVKKVFETAMKRADVAMIKLIWSYMDGLPKQLIRIDDTREDILESKRWIDEVIRTAGTA